MDNPACHPLHCDLATWLPPGRWRCCPRAWPVFSAISWLSLPFIWGQKKEGGNKGPQCSWWAWFSFFWSSILFSFGREHRLHMAASWMGRYLWKISKLGAETSSGYGCCPHQFYNLVRYTDIKQIVVTKVTGTSKQSASCHENARQGNLNGDLVREVLQWGSDRLPQELDDQELTRQREKGRNF